MSIKIIIEIGVWPTRKKIFTVLVVNRFSFLSLRTAQAKSHKLQKDRMVNSDPLDALRLSLKGYTSIQK
jgi:hypothetical protein